ncbi:MAG: hydrogenase 3 maturation endopeptidase HyCI [Thermococci archaeon]|nr:hydrogenase 3 maturation endopeptidase HyCI [Thermococci archaeon]
MNLEELFQNAKHIVICGIGNDMRGDDAFGVLVASRLAEKVREEGVRIINCGEVPESYVGKITEEKPDLVVFVDAVDFKGRVGELIVTDPEGTLGEAVSTHGLPLRILVGYLKDVLPDTRFVLVGCQPASTGFLEEPCQEVLEAVERVTSYLEALIGRRSKSEA